MSDIFLQLVNTSLSAGILVLAVTVLRLCLKNSPRWITCALWGLVALRLLCPISLESVFSLIPSPVSTGAITESFWQDYAGSTQTYHNDTPEYWEAVDAGLQPHHSGNGDYYVITDSRDHLKSPATRKEALVPALTGIWLAGMAVLSVYALVSYLRLRKRVSPALQLGDNLYCCDYIDSPFILGLIRPRIYLPSAIRPEQVAHVVAHEWAHLARRDHWWKPLGYGLLCLHWFNPLLWLGYILLCRDIELACDEKVIRQLEPMEKKSYSEALLECSMPRYWVAACPLAFGEVGVKDRVKAVLNYRKPAFWVVLVAVAALVVTAVCFLTDPLGTRRILPGSYRYNGTVCHYPISSQDNVPIVPSGLFYLEDDNSLYVQNMDTLRLIVRMQPYDLTAEELNGYLDDPRILWDLGKVSFSPGEALWRRAENGTFYLLFQSNGKTYLARGIEDYVNRDTPLDTTQITELVELVLIPEAEDRNLICKDGYVTEVQDDWFCFVEAPTQLYRVPRIAENGDRLLPENLKVDDFIRVIYSGDTHWDHGTTTIDTVHSVQILDEEAYNYHASTRMHSVVPLQLPLGTDVFHLEESLPVLMLQPEDNYSFSVVIDDWNITNSVRIYDETTQQEVARSQLQPGRTYLATAGYKALYCFRIIMPHDLGITLSARNVTPTSLTIDCVQSGGTYPGPFVYRETYTLEYYNGVKWVPVKTHTGTYQGFFPSVAYYLHKGESVSWYVDLNKHYPPLAPGHYRYAITFVADAVDNYSARTLYAEFMIPSGSESNYYSLNQAILDGWVASVDGDVVANQQVWMDFVAQVDAGNPAQVRYVTYYTIGNPDRMSHELFQESRERYPIMTFYDLSYDGDSFTLRWLEGETEYLQNWKYLMHYTVSPAFSSVQNAEYDTYVLTDREDVTYQELWDGLVSADFRDQIPFREVYTDISYANEPTLAELNKAMEKLEPYMLNYSIASLDVNELTGRLDIEVREWKDGLFDLIAKFVDTDFVVVTELRGEIALTGTLEE